VSVIVAGTFRVPTQNLPGLKPHMATVVAATRAEDGCLGYSYGEDVGEPGLIRVFEIWRDQACVDAHFQSAHMKIWQEVRAAAGLYDRDIKLYAVSGEAPL
jgi:quinol monooxygenase YgiN